jgi:hypothetical protein
VWDELIAGHLGAGSTGATLNNAGGIDTYQAKVVLLDDDSALADRYLVAFFKNGEPVMAGVTNAKLQVVDATGANLLPLTNLVAVGATGYFKYDAVAPNRIASGAGYIAKAQWDQDAVTHEWPQPVGRDST